MSSILWFYDPSFPYDGVRPDEAALARLRQAGELADAAQLAAKLQGASCLVWLHGAYFPKAAWSSVIAFLQGGGNLLHMGGEAFRKPVNGTPDTGWSVEREQTAYHRQLQIHEIMQVDAGPVHRYQAAEDISLFQGCEELFSIQPTESFILHVTRASDHPGDDGSSGPMDAHITALMKGISNDGREVAAPVVLIENTKGVFAGGRWLFVNLKPEDHFWAAGADALVQWANYCVHGVTEVWLKPGYASYEPGEQAMMTLQAQRLGRYEGAPLVAEKWTFSLVVTQEGEEPSGEQVRWAEELELEVSQELTIARIRLSFPIEAGYYRVSCEARSASGESRVYRQGFWGYDERLLREGEALGCERDYLVKDGQPFPVVGMTYMASDVARKYLFLPNVSVWERDIAQMRRAGINLIRSGLWTGWRKIMFVDGHAYEEVLRAIDALLLTAKKHGMEVTFNFFAFTPEAWEGVNPYLDPRSVEAQKRFIAAIVSRHAQTTNVNWDLINEPSLFDPKRIFEGPVTLGDAYEHAAFAAWLKERHGDITKLQERWDMSPQELPDFNAVKLAEIAKITLRTTPIIPRQGAPLLDYTLFTMEMHNQWAEALTRTIRASGGKQLVTVGQDEALAAQRPSPFFYASSVDYTTVHSWWKMDQLVMDSIFAKDTNKPCLVQETGIMYVETPHGRAKRTETELYHILERKYAYAFAAGGAGAVQWIWNTNCYMNNVNESNIGALRADGTEKPEANVSYDFGAFMSGIRDLFVARELEEVVVVYPYSNDFSTRKLAYEAVSKLTRTLAYELNVPFRAVGEYHLESLASSPAKLIIVPSAHNFATEALESLLGHLEEQGGTMLFTGPLGLDAYWTPEARIKEMTGERQLRNVRREELLVLEGQQIPVSFGGERIAQLSKEATEDGGISTVQVYSVGKGKLIWCPLPVELNERTEPLSALYRYALQAAQVEPELEWIQGGQLPGVYGRKLAFAAGALFVFVSESAVDAEIEVRDPATGSVYQFELGSERSILFAADKSGVLRASYRGQDIRVTHDSPLNAALELE